MSSHSHNSDYSRYFSLRQKVYLINMSEKRNSEIYESLSGVVTFSDVHRLELMVVSHGTHDDEALSTTYKLTSEALGSGIQVLAELTGIIAGNLFQFRMQGALEMFQRRSVTRADLSVPLFHLHRNSSLSFFKKEWKRVMEHLRSGVVLPGLVLQEAEINLSAGGVGLTLEGTSRPSPISMFFAVLDEGLPVCALTETVWEQRGDDGLRCGFRFIHILKADQERINDRISSEIHKSGGTPLHFKRNWVLVDKMVAGDRKPG